MFFQKIPKIIISFCNYFLKLNFGFFLAQNISMNGPGFWRVIFLRSFLRARILSGHFLGEEKYRSKGKYFERIQMQTPFKFFIVEEVMSSSLITFEFEFTGEGESHFIPSHSKVLKSFQISLKFQSLKQTNNQSNNFINIPKFGMLQIYHT